MTRSLLKRSAIAAVLLMLGIVFVSGNNSMYSRAIATYSAFEVAIVLATLIAGLCLLIFWALRSGNWSHRKSARGRTASLLLVFASACFGSQQHGYAWVAIPAAHNAIQQPFALVHQGFALAPEQQRQVDEAVADVSEQAKDAPGFVMSVEMAIGIFIAAVLIGTTLYVVVRLVCQSLDRMKLDIQNRLSKVRTWLEHPGPTNTPAIIGAGLWRGREATSDDLPRGLELLVGCIAPEPDQPFSLSTSVPKLETIGFSEFLSGFGLPDKFPVETSVGNAVSRQGAGYLVAPRGFTNLVTLTIESKQGVTNAFKSVLRLRCPVGAILDVSDLTGASGGRFWRIGVVP